MARPGLGEQIKRLRERRGLTQAALAARVGMSTVFIRKLEAGERLASMDTLQKLAEALDASVRIELVGHKRRANDGRQGA